MNSELNKKIQAAEAYLSQFKVNEGKYIIGVFQGGITIYKQQIRALNIFYCLYITGKLSKKDCAVAVIGGGVAGLTFATALLKSHVIVHLFEKDDNYIPFQSGCNEREVHPHVYDWPDEGADKQSANLPVLNWQADQANLVAKQLVDGFHEARDHFEKEALSPFNYLYENLGEDKQVTAINYSSKEKTFTLVSPAKETYCDLIIYATGYGVERGYLENNGVIPYWRPTGFGQAFLKSPAHFLISGFGDGAVMDLFVLRIDKFKSSELISLIQNDPRSGHLKSNLADIKRTFYEGNQPDDFLFKSFRGLDENHYSYIYPKLKMRNSKVVLTGRQDFEKALNLNNVSLLNAFLLFILKKHEQFEYIKGETIFDSVSKTYSIKDHPRDFSGYTPIIRWGTEVKLTFTKELFDDKDRVSLDKLEKRQIASTKHGIVRKEWNEGELDQIFDMVNFKEISSICGDMYAAFTTFTNSLAITLFHTKKSELPFRLALHKVIRRQDLILSQQITPYAGSKTYNKNGHFGKPHRIDVGCVGYSIDTGEPALISLPEDISESNVDLQDLITRMKIVDLSSDAKKARSFLTVPIYAPNPNSERRGERATKLVPNLILYLESEQSGRFDDPATIDLIVGALGTLVQTIKSAIEFKQVNMDETEHIPQPQNINKEFKDLKKNKYFITTGESYARLHREKLQFESFHTFSLEKKIN